MAEALTRRGFLGWTATGAAGLLVPGLIGPRPKVFDMGRGARRTEASALDFRVYTSRDGIHFREIHPATVTPSDEGFFTLSVARDQFFDLGLTRGGTLRIVRTVVLPSC